MSFFCLSYIDGRFNFGQYMHFFGVAPSHNDIEYGDPNLSNVMGNQDFSISSALLSEAKISKELQHKERWHPPLKPSRMIKPSQNQLR